MPGDIVYFDLETRRTANDVGGWGNKHLMGISVAVTFSTARNEYTIYTQDEAPALVEQLKRADLVVDMAPVLASGNVGSLSYS